MCFCLHSYHHRHRQSVSPQFSSIIFSKNLFCPLLKNYIYTLDKDELSDYRPICNLFLISKIIERVVKCRPILITLSPVVFSILTSLPTASITPLKHPYSESIVYLRSSHQCHQTPSTPSGLIGYRTCKF